MSDGPKFSGPAHVIFADIFGAGQTTIERILGRRVLGVQPDLQALIKQHGGYAKIPPEAFPPSKANPLTARQQQAMKGWPAVAGDWKRKAS
jgi:hypothetical protein